MSRIRDAAHAARVARGADRLEAMLADVPHIGGTSWEARQGEKQRHDAAIRALKARLSEIGFATHRDDWQGARLTLLGLSASSTSGFYAAARNWVSQARAKVAAWHAAQGSEAAE